MRFPHSESPFGGPGRPAPAKVLSIVAAAMVTLAGAKCHAQLLWDTSAAGGIQGGSGNWLGTVTWSGILGGRTQWVDGNVAVFNAGSGTVTLNGAVTANGLVFNVDGYVINGSSILTLGGATPTITVSDAGETARIEVAISGAAGLTKSGNGALSMGGSAFGNTYTGSTVINGGRITITSSGGVLPTNTPVVIAN